MMKAKMMPKKTVMEPSLVPSAVTDCAADQHIQDEEPSPSSQAGGTVHSKHAGGDQATETVSELLADEEHGVSLAELLLGVPRAEEVQRTGEEDGFGGTEQDSDAQEGRVRLDRCGAGRDGAPDDTLRDESQVGACFGRLTAQQISGVSASQPWCAALPNSQSPGRGTLETIQLLGIWNGR